MEIRPQVPAVMGDADGAPTIYASRYMRNAVATAFEQLGGVEGLVAWAATNLDTREKFYTKLAAKLIVKQVEVSDTRSVEDIIDQLDGAPETVRSVPSEALDAEFEDMREYE